MGRNRITVSEGVAKGLVDPDRAAINDILDYDIPPRGLSGSDLKNWLYKSYDADQTCEAFAVLMEDLYFAVWAPAIGKHIPFSSTRRLLDRERESAVAKSLIADIWNVSAGAIIPH